MSNKVSDYFNGDTLAVNVWVDKYCLKNNNGIAQEETPADMHLRMAKEFARIEHSYATTEINSNPSQLSEFGKKLIQKRIFQSLQDIEQEFFNYFDKFEQIVPQGSIMSNLGNFFIYGSLSNCFGIADPYDSYGGIMKTDEHLSQLMKRRGGVGLNLDNIRPSGTKVSNASKSSTGIVSYAERYSNTTREVAQEGRRGALMQLLHCAHPDIFKFVTMKDDRTKVTGANVSVKFTDEFMQALEKGWDFVCRFPVTLNIAQDITFNNPNSILTIKLNSSFDLTYNKLVDFPQCVGHSGPTLGQVMLIKPQELFDLVSEMAWKNAEPGVAFYDRVVDYSPEGVYDRYKPRVCNPCGEQWFAFNETCRLIAANLMALLKRCFEEDAEIDYELAYEIFYMQQRLGDNLVDLECEYIDRILSKIDSDFEPEHIKVTEKQLWIDIQKIARDGRRTGSGFTALGDMLAGLGLKYDSDEAIAVIEQVMKTKMKAELDCTIDMAILRGTFVGWDKDKELWSTSNTVYAFGNSFFKMLYDEFPEQAVRMMKYGRRNTNWSTVAPTGTVSLMTQTTSGLEPLFKAYYIRRKKINPSEEGSRVDFIDQNGDKWQEYAVLHPKFKNWINWTNLQLPVNQRSTDKIEDLHKDIITQYFKESPWYKSEADDISWEKRIDIQSIIQKYTSNAISSTINLPNNVAQQVVKDIYLRAYHKGLKGVTVYRDGSRSGVLVNEPAKANIDKFGYTDSVKRPTELKAYYHPITVKGKLFAVIVGVLDELPYEIFAFENPVKDEKIEGKIIKNGKGQYSFISNNYTIKNIQLSSEHTDEKLLTRFVSQMLRHGINPKHIVEQVEKTQVTVVSFAKAIARVLRLYIPKKDLNQICNVCKEPTVIYEEGCRKCTNCGDSKC